MSLYLFPQDGGKALRYEFAGHKGGKIRVPAGHYDALCLNSDTEGIYYRNTEKRTTFEVTIAHDSTPVTPFFIGCALSKLPPAPEGTKNERVALEPGPCVERPYGKHTTEKSYRRSIAYALSGNIDTYMYHRNPKC